MRVLPVIDKFEEVKNQDRENRKTIAKFMYASFFMFLGIVEGFIIAYLIGWGC